ncbi:MAG: alpha/beta fold hydrolase [Acidimicrobiia bacterium]|nr:alpha/beta fold hydrolase [Acidimicrobiia bacterium]
MSLSTTDGFSLEHRWSIPHTPNRVAVLCHPHPLHGGSMNAPLLRRIKNVLVDRGFAVLRFNFRGVGESEGTFGGGVSEVLDVDAAIDLARSTYPDLPLGIAGWSFGSVTALRWSAQHRAEMPYAGIGTPIGSDLSLELPELRHLAPAPRTFIIGDNDQFTTVAKVQEYAATIGAQVAVVPGSDHFFFVKEGVVGELVADALSR